MRDCDNWLFALVVVLGACQGGAVAADPSMREGKSTASLPDIDWASARVVTVQMIDDRFVPDRFVFQRGTAYRLHLDNAGTDVHEFTAPEFLKAIAIRNPDVLERTRMDEILLQPKEQKDLYFVARNPGRYRLTCANHDWDNMVGEITIE
jgi:uncharacterized cupredoxin-like copper-binding protein